MLNSGAGAQAAAVDFFAEKQWDTLVPATWKEDLLTLDAPRVRMLHGLNPEVQLYLKCLWSRQSGETGYLPALKLTDLYSRPSMRTCEQSVTRIEADLGG